MMCERCGKVEAVVRTSHVAEGRTIAMHWCRQCAEALGQSPTSSSPTSTAAEELEWLVLDAKDQPDRVSEAEEQRAVQLIAADVAATLGSEHEDEIRRQAALVRTWWYDRPSYVARVAEGVQQYLHDCFIDITWPQCPRHPNHPLWLHDGMWQCERDGVAISPLGGLGEVTARGARDRRGSPAHDALGLHRGRAPLHRIRGAPRARDLVAEPRRARWTDGAGDSGTSPGGDTPGAGDSDGLLHIPTDGSIESENGKLNVLEGLLHALWGACIGLLGGWWLAAALPLWDDRVEFAIAIAVGALGAALAYRNGSAFWNAVGESISRI